MCAGERINQSLVEHGEMESKLEQLYYGLPAPSAYAGGYRVVRAAHKNLSPDKVKEWLESQDAHTLHKMVRYRFPRRTYRVFSPHELWEADLADMRAFKTYNDQYTYLLVVIDVLSKYARVEHYTIKQPCLWLRVWKKFYNVTM